MRRLARVLASASIGIATNATAATAIPSRESSGLNPKTSPASDVTTTKAQRTRSSAAEIRAVNSSVRSTLSVSAPRDSADNRHSSTSPLRSSTTESRPKAASSTLRAMSPAISAIAASAAIHATVAISRRMPRATAAALAEVSIVWLSNYAEPESCRQRSTPLGSTSRCGALSNIVQSSGG